MANFKLATLGVGEGLKIRTDSADFFLAAEFHDQLLAKFEGRKNPLDAVSSH